MGELVDRDEEHLRLLKLCYYILAGMTALYSVFSMVFLLFSGLIYSSVKCRRRQAPNSILAPSL